VDGWLDKNKDPLNQTVLDLFRKSTNKLMAGLFPQVAEESETFCWICLFQFHFLDKARNKRQNNMIKRRHLI